MRRPQEAADKGGRDMSCKVLAASVSTIAIAVCAGHASAQSPAQSPEAGGAPSPAAETIVVTGTLLAGSAETGSLPIQVVDDEELELRGNPSTLDLIKSIPAVGATLGDSNRFGGQNAGGVSVNLRNLGADKTLVLLNGKRMPTSQLIDTGGVDVAYIPSSAVGRIEVLLDGASTTYGSDAMAGVVNFISKAGFDGLEASGSYDYIDGSNGDYKAEVVFGRREDWGNILLTANYYHRSELQSHERDWTSRPFELDPQNGWSVGAPGSYLIGSSRNAAAYTGRFVDPGCEANGGILVNGNIRGAGTGCRYHNAYWTNLADDTDGYGLYGEINVNLAAGHKFHMDGFYSGHDVPRDVQEPAYTPSSRFPLAEAFGGNNPINPAAGRDTVNGFYIPYENPGLQTLLALYPTVFSAGDVANIRANGLLTVSGAWRPYGYGGNLLTDGPQRSSREGWAHRISAGFNGPLAFGVDYNVGFTHGQTIFDRSTMEFTTANLQWALRGLGGEGCTPGGTNPATSTPGVGPCLWFNPFSTGVAVNRQTGAVNPDFAAAFAINPQVANTEEVARYIQELPYAFRDESRFTTIDASINGTLPISLWSGDEIAWAVGSTYMWTQDVKDVPPATALESAPCPTPGITTCQTQTGPLTFFGALPPYSVDTERYAVFGEMFFPILDNLEATVALRYEDLGEQFGTTTDPKVNLRWQVVDALALRGSASSTFKAPYPTRFVGGIASGFNAAQLNRFVNTLPINNQPLSPEKANNYSVGAILDIAGFTATLDYYKIELEGAIEGDSGASMLAAFFGGVGQTSNANCSADPSNPYYALQQRFVFTGGRGDAATCALQNLQAIYVGSSNSQDYEVSGIDFVANYTMPFLSGDLNFGLDYNYVLEFVGSGSSVEGVALSSGGPTNYAGTLGGGGFAALPRSKGNLFAEYATGPHNVRLTYHYVEGMEDISSSIFPANATNLYGKYMQDWTPVDLTYRLELPAELTLNLGIINLFDRDPPAQRQALAYNTYTASPLGRVFRVGLKKAF